MLVLRKLSATENNRPAFPVFRKGRSYGVCDSKNRNSGM